MKIVFCHNVFDRFNTLHHTIKTEKVLYQNSKTIVGYNNADPRTEINYHWDDIEWIKYHGLTHKIGCANGCIVTIQAALKHDPDIIIFSHDDVYINGEYTTILNKNLKDIYNGVTDVIVRKTPDHSVIGGKYYMMEAFILSKKAAIKCFGDLQLFDNEEDITRDIKNSVSPEVFLYNVLNIEGIKVNALDFNNAAPIEKYNDLLGETIGFHHKNIGYRGWNDKTDYTQSWKLF
jgi:hypothetical protein